MTVVLRTHNLSKDYGNSSAVDRLNIEVRQGEIYGFLGRNGAGKTTTIRMLLGLVKPTRGKIELFGRDLTRFKYQLLPRVGSMVETPGFYRNLTAIENLKISARLLGVTSKHAVQEALETVGLGKEGHKLVARYSLGMKQRLGIARAIMHKPELLILDEPTNGLDPVGITEVRRLIKYLTEQRAITVFMSSHILSEVQQMATTVGIIHEGQLVEQVSIEQLHQRSRRYLEIKVSNDRKAAFVLENKLGIHDYEVRHDCVIRVYSHLESAAQINQALVDGGVYVSQLASNEDSLEDYFVRLTGGADNA